MSIHRAWIRAGLDVEQRRVALAEVGENRGPITCAAARCITFLRFALTKETS